MISIRLPRHSIWDLTPHDCLGFACDLLTTALDLPSAAFHCPKLVGASSPLPRHRVERHMHPSAVNADAWPTHLTTPTPFRSGRHDAVRATLHLQTAGWLPAEPPGLPACLLPVSSPSSTTSLANETLTACAPTSLDWCPIITRFDVRCLVCLC